MKRGWTGHRGVWRGLDGAWLCRRQVLSWAVRASHRWGAGRYSVTKRTRLVKAVTG
jgi:hypothetical protein